MSYIDKKTLVRSIQQILRGDGVEITQTELGAAFPGRPGSHELLGIWSRMAPGRTYRAWTIISQKLGRSLSESPEPQRGEEDRKEDGQQADRQRAEVHTELFVIIPPELDPDDCPCGCKGGRLSLKCPNCDEILW